MKYALLIALVALVGCNAKAPSEQIEAAVASPQGMSITEAMNYMAYDADGNEPSVTAKAAFDTLHNSCASSKITEVCNKRDWLQARLKPWCFSDNRGWGPCMIPTIEYNDLVSEFGRNPIDAREKYRGQLIEVRGPISHMEAYDNGAAEAVMGYKFNDGLRNFNVRLLFDDGSHLSGISIGDRIGVECVILGFHDNAVICGIE